MSEQAQRVGEEEGKFKSDPTALTTDALHREIAQLRELMDERDRRYREVMDERDKRYYDRFEAQDKAVLKAETATEKRFESVNEFRAQLADQSNQFMPRGEYTVQHVSLDEKVNLLASRVDEKVNLVAARVSEVDSRVSAVEQKKVGSVESRQGIYAAAGFILVLLTIAGIIAGVMANSGP
jgi:bisphosphoglycerate-dependent phosphoglycerate mutase